MRLPVFGPSFVIIASFDVGGVGLLASVGISTEGIAAGAADAVMTNFWGSGVSAMSCASSRSKVASAKNSPPVAELWLFCGVTGSGTESSIGNSIMATEELLSALGVPAPCSTPAVGLLNASAVPEGSADIVGLG